MLLESNTYWHLVLSCAKETQQNPVKLSDYFANESLSKKSRGTFLFLTLKNHRISISQNTDEVPSPHLQEFRVCNLESCPEVRRNTPWTPWMPVNMSQDGARQEQRFRYTCRAPLHDPQQLQLGKKKLETRFCPNDGSEACQTGCEYRYKERKMNSAL